MIMHVTVKLKTGASFGKYRETVRECKAVFETHGWELLASYTTVVGRVNTCVNIWDIPSFDAIEAGLYDRALGAITPKVRELVDEEITSLMTSYSVD